MVSLLRQLLSGTRWMLLGIGIAWIAFPLRAQDGRPVVGPGATKEEVINAYGWPSGHSQSGTKEILTYPQGRITIENGRVEKMDFSPNVPWPAPRPRPAPASPTSVKKAEPFPDFWLERFEDAQREASRRNARILALFIGSDWSPPSRQFQEEVAFHPDFVNTFTGDFVFLRLDFPTRTAQPPEIRDQNSRLRATYEVTTYPALLVLSPGGTMVATIDLTKLQPGETYRERVIAAIREVRDLLVAQPPPPEPATPPVVAQASSPAPASAENVGNPVVASSLGSAFNLVMGAIVVGLLLAGLGWWLVWRKPADSATSASTMAARISDAASGLPSPPQIAAWSKEKICAVVAALAEADGYIVRARGGGDDGDFALVRSGEPTPAVIVACVAGETPPISVKRLRELFGAMVAEGVKSGWYVAASGFTKEAREFAHEHHVRLVGTAELLDDLRAIPPIQLRKILVRGG